MQLNSSFDEVHFHPYHCQDFNEIRDWCLRRGLFFEDPYFKLDSNYEWKRPWEIAVNPRLFVDGACRFDVLQGELGDCWMLAAITTLAMHPDLVKKVIPTDQSFEFAYAGIFHFRFWQFGKWFDVVIDDRLPTLYGRLVFTRSATQNEFWSALFEKAYCKILGDSYSVADAGNLCEALEDFTGGVVEQFLLRCVPRNFKSIFLNSIERHSLVGCFIDDIPGTYQSETPEGLVRGHSYSVTGAKSVKLPIYGDIVLVRLRNPWGRFEWRGPWSDHSQEWRSVPDVIKKNLGIVYQDDGEFWMSYSDFVSHFQWVDMCHLSPEAFSDYYGSASGISTWKLNMFRGNWVLGITAGGAKVLHKNPQMRFNLREADRGNAEGRSSVLIALIQKTTGRNVEEYNEIGLKIYSVTDRNYDRTWLDKSFFQKNRSIGQVAAKRAREVAGRFNLERGTYCIIPFTYEAEREGEFLVRIYSERITVTDQVDRKVTFSEVETKTSETPPMKIITGEDDLKSGDHLKEQFYKVSNGAKEVGWKGLKNILDLAVKEDLAPAVKSSGLGHFLMDMASYVYHKIVEPPKETINAFATIGPGGFSNEVCRSMLALLDVDHSGKIIFDEFKMLWKEIQKWKSIYEQHSVETKGYLNSSELKEALEAAGFRMNNRILTDIVHRYATEDGKISFDEFLSCSLKIKTMSDIFRSKDTFNVRRAEFTLDEFLEKTLYS